MKYLFLSLFAIMALFSTSCKQSSTQAIVSGTMDSYEKLANMYCLVSLSENLKIDTIAVQADGTFKHALTLDKPMRIGLLFEYLDDTKSSIYVFMVNGTESKVKITHSKNERGHLIPTAEFYGDNKEESDFIKAQTALTSGNDFRLKTIAGFKTFKEYRASVKEKLDGLRTLLNESKNAEFKADCSADLNREEINLPFRFEVAKSTIGERPDADADFVAYVKSFDLNDTVNLKNGITDRILRWYEGCEPNPDNESKILRLMKCMKKLVGNQEVINVLSTKLMKNVLDGGSDDLKGIYGLYVQINTDKTTQEEIAPLYMQLVKYAKGTPATDFEMQDAKGKTVRFLELVGKGKVTYIDFWATWCGPCCAEIPYIEKFVEKYKNNPNIEFISISMDSDRSKWHKKLEKDKPQWKQFIIPGNFNSAFAKEYYVYAIPRFMIFDKQGKIISVNALRPSDKKMEAFIQPYIQ